MLPQDKPVFSLVVVYRDREIPRVKFFLDSLQNQTEQCFELVFVDYGSQPKYQKEVEDLVNQYAFARYIYTDTRGWFWNRSRALNLGVDQTNTDHIITLDIDLIFEPGFIKKAARAFSSGYYTRFYYYYLPKGFHQYSKLFSNNYQPQQKLEKTSDTTNFGVLGFTKSDFLKAGGYNDYYQIWGLEDIDFVKRLEASGTLSQGFIDEVMIYHQWHPKSQLQLPKGWYEQMHQYFEEQLDSKKLNPENTVSTPSSHLLVTTNHRPALLAKIQKQSKKEECAFEFSFPKELSFVKFMHLFHQLEPGQQIRVQQTFQLINDYKNTRWGRLMHQINRLLARFGISYRWVDLSKFDLELISKKEVSDFIFHFLITCQAQIIDYYFEYQTNDDEVVFIVIKK